MYLMGSKRRGKGVDTVGIIPQLVEDIEKIVLEFLDGEGGREKIIEHHIRLGLKIAGQYDVDMGVAMMAIVTGVDAFKIKWDAGECYSPNITGYLAQRIHTACAKAKAESAVVYVPKGSLHSMGGEGGVEVVHEEYSGFIPPEENLLGDIYSACSNDIEKAIVKLKSEGWGVREIAKKLSGNYFRISKSKISRLLSKIKERYEADNCYVSGDVSTKRTNHS